MKILAALKKIKHLDRKIVKNRERMAKYCSVIMEDSSADDPPYDEEDIRKMSQRITDLALEKANIRAALHKTNVRVKTEFLGKECSIDELLLYQNVVLPEKMRALKTLRRKEKNRGYNSHDKDAYVLNQFDPRERDAAIEKMEDEMTQLDTLLDNMNIETDVIGLD
jgi:hypothetical protein